MGYRKMERKKGGWAGNHIGISVELFINGHSSMLEMSELHPCFPSLLKGLLHNGLVLFPPAVRTPLLDLTHEEGLITGKKFSKTLKGKTNVALAADQWTLVHPAMVDLSSRYPFFAPMIISIGQDKLDNAIWGVKFRIYFGAGLSVADIVTDLAAIHRFFKEGNTKYGYINLSFIGVSTLLQLFLVCGNNRKRGWKVIARESLIVFTMLKPIVDAKRVARGDVQDEDAEIDPKMEHSMTKISELFFESLPSVIIQTYAVLGSNLHWTTCISISVSVLAISYTSSIISLDKDSDPKKRLVSATIYGYLKAENRTKVLVVMVFFSACHTVAKVLACALLVKVRGLWLLRYMLSDMAIFFLYKIVRNDFHYWVPINGVLGLQFGQLDYSPFRR